jgi:acyl carrier protein
LLPWVELHNLYGPTEAAIDATHWHCVSGVGGVLIGRPIGNAAVYILDAQMQPTPVGVAGELYIGGAGLARGYLQRPDLTAARFVPDPFSKIEGRRLYRTGDIGRYLPDGNIEFLGRADNQLKLRGYRIELGEIEAALTRQAQVREAAVIARAGEEGEKRLVAYVVPQESAEALNVSELRGALKARLPAYMLPSSFVVLDKLPRTPNGKLDLKALPTTQTLQPQVETAYVAPRTEIEQIVADIWRRVLQVAQVGVNDNFFDLGGHSLLVLRIHRELQETFQRDILMTELFQYPTVSALAAFLSGATAEQPALEQSQQRTETRRRLAAQQRSRRTQRVAE